MRFCKSQESQPGFLPLLGFFGFGLGFLVLLFQEVLAAAELDQGTVGNDSDDAPADEEGNDAVKGGEDAFGAEEGGPDVGARCHSGGGDQGGAAAGNAAVDQNDDGSGHDSGNDGLEDQGNDDLPPAAEHIRARHPAGGQTNDDVDNDEGQVNGVCDTGQQVGNCADDGSYPGATEHAGENRSDDVQIHRQLQQGCQLSAYEVNGNAHRNGQNSHHGKIVLDAVLLQGFLVTHNHILLFCPKTFL